ncbi:C-type lectin domain family 4 member M-like [Aulostomus maculatus]
MYRLIAVSFGLLCVLLAALNISLRLDRTTDKMVKNLMNETDKLKRELKDCNASDIKTLREERDQLKKKLSDFIHYSQRGWDYFKWSFYHVSSTERDWEACTKYCLQKGAALMTINSPEEQNLISNWRDYMWIGLYDKNRKGTWTWVDGTPLNTSYWGPGEPNNYKQTGEYCVEVWRNEMVWNDRKCEDQNYCICEKDLSRPTGYQEISHISASFE